MNVHLDHPIVPTRSTGASHLQRSTEHADRAREGR